MLDDSAPFQDYSGYSRAGVMDTGSPTTAASLVAGAVFSSVFSNSVDAKFDSPVYVQGYERQSFSLEASVRVIDESGTGSVQKVLSSASNYDGITIDDTVVSFSTKYMSAGEAKVSYDIGIKRNVHIVGVHTVDKNQLFVDGVLVGEVDITDIQQSDTFVTTDGKLWLGTSVSSQKVAVNAVAIFGSALNTESVKSHFNAARRATLAAGVATSFGGNRFPLSLQESDVYLKTVFSTDSDWKLGVLDQVTVVDSQLVPQLIEGDSVAGTWQSVVNLDSGTSSIYGISLTWDAQGAELEVSLDGTTWETPIQGQSIDLVPDGFDPFDQDLHIKISFAGGVTDDPSYVDNLQIVGILTGNIPVIDGRTTTFTAPASPMFDTHPLEQKDNFGTKLDGGTITISEDTSGVPDDAFTINIWMKKLTSTTPTISVSGTTYKNGQAGGTLNIGEWVMYTIVKASAITGDITIAGDAQVGSVEIFDSQLSAQQVADLYTSSIGVPKISVSETDDIEITNPSPSTKIYDYDWAILSAG